MAPDELRILFVEDSAQDVMLEERALRKGGVAFKSRVVETAIRLRVALMEFRPHVIISDDKLPELDGLTALRISHEMSPDVPFIFVSGTLGEEQAVARLKQGATDYVVKGRLEGLAHAVERGLKEARDRDERLKLEEQYRQSQKMEVVGRLAGGVAHDFNNLLTAIIGYSQLVAERLAPDDVSRPDLEQVLRATDRAAALTRQLLAVSRKQALQPRVIDLNVVVAEMERLLRRVIGDSIELVCAPTAGLGKVKADPGQIEQVILNLAVNARDAMPGGGRMTLGTANVELDRSHTDQRPEIRVGPHVMLYVQDAGSGMTDEVRKHLFEPFFTTKPAGIGTGLGLSIVYGIVDQSRGSIGVESEPGKGATFRVYLPRVDEAVSATRADSVVLSSTRGDETILVVDDSPVIRHLVRSVLSRKGYQIIEAEDGRNALELCPASRQPLHLLLTDIAMRGMGGRELAKTLRADRPNLKVLYISGSVEEAGDREIDASSTEFLAKPFTVEALARRVREILDATA